MEQARIEHAPNGSLLTYIKYWYNELTETVLESIYLKKRTVKDTAAGELTPYPFPQLANGTGLNRTRAQWKFTNVY